MFFKKIEFLIKSNAPKKIIYNFIFSKVKNLFIKKKKKKFKKENQEFLKKKYITTDYFSSNSFYFYKILEKIKNLKYLEIGAFEGNSSMFVARKFKTSKVYCVDNWEGKEEYYKIDFNKIENNFDFNTHEYKNITKIKKNSDNFFLENNIKFSVIYIDGYHKATQVFKDFQNSWKSLLPNGIIIFDDYIWQFFEDIKDNPCYGINQFLKTIKNEYDVLLVSNSQLFIKKKNLKI